MLDSKRHSEARVRARRRSAGRLATALAGLAALVAPAGCAPRTLVVVSPCTDGGAAACPPSPNVTLLDGLVGLWHLDEPPGSTVAVDSSGNQNDGTLMDLDPTTAWVTGHDHGGLRTGGTGFVQVPLSPSIAAISTGVTIAAWISPEGTVDPADKYGTAISRQIGTTIDQYYHLSVNVNYQPALFIAIAASPSKPAFLAAPKAAPRTGFTHVAGTYDGAVARLYVDGSPDGVPEASAPITGTFREDTTPLLLGANGNENAVTERFPGRLDEVVLYNRALDSEEIARLAAGGLSSVTVPRISPSLEDGGRGN